MIMYCFALQSHSVNGEVTEAVKRRSLRVSWGSKKRKAVNKQIKSASSVAETGSTDTIDTIGGASSHYPINRTASLDQLVSSSVNPGIIASSSHRAVSPEGLPYFQGYLKVKEMQEDKWSRCWCILEDLTIKCHTSQHNLTVTQQVPLRGSTIARSDAEAKKKFTFRVWNSDTRLSFFFSAYDNDEFQTWFSEVTDGAEQLAAEVFKKPASKASTSPVFYYSREGRIHSNSTHSRSIQGSRNSLDHSDGDSGSMVSGGQQAIMVAYQGQLKKRGEKSLWTTYHCEIKGAHLMLFQNQSDQSPVNVVPLRECSIQRINLPPHEVERYVFTVLLHGTTHTLAAPSDQALLGWLQAIQAYIVTLEDPLVNKVTPKLRRGQRRSRKEKSRSEIFAPSLSVTKPVPTTSASSLVSFCVCTCTFSQLHSLCFFVLMTEDQRQGSS